MLQNAPKPFSVIMSKWWLKTSLSQVQGVVNHHFGGAMEPSFTFKFVSYPERVSFCYFYGFSLNNKGNKHFRNNDFFFKSLIFHLHPNFCKHPYFLLGETLLSLPAQKNPSGNTHDRQRLICLTSKKLLQGLRRRVKIEWRSVAHLKRIKVPATPKQPVLNRSGIIII